MNATAHRDLLFMAVEFRNPDGDDIVTEKEKRERAASGYPSILDMLVANEEVETEEAEPSERFTWTDKDEDVFRVNFDDKVLGYADGVPIIWKSKKKAPAPTNGNEAPPIEEDIVLPVRGVGRALRSSAGWKTLFRTPHEVWHSLKRRNDRLWWTPIRSERQYALRWRLGGA